jgi:hypothetical protein
LSIEAIETGERALISYRWEQIGSKRMTYSRMQRRSPGLLPYAIGAHTDAVPMPDRLGKLGERGGYSTRARCFGDEFVVAGAKVWMNVNTQAPIVGAAAGRIQPRRLWGEAVRACHRWMRQSPAVSASSASRVRPFAR